MSEIKMKKELEIVQMTILLHRIHCQFPSVQDMICFGTDTKKLNENSTITVSHVISLCYY